MAGGGHSPVTTDFDARMAELRTRFVQEAAKEHERLVEAFGNDDHAAVRGIAHSLSGRAGMFGFPELSEQAAALEAAIDDEPEQLRPAYDALLGSLELVIR
jgi:HPt (histidine-containing phosphotransfer) domain-containing protein